MQRLQLAQALSVHVQSIKISALILFKASQWIILIRNFLLFVSLRDKGMTEVGLGLMSTVAANRHNWPHMFLLSQDISFRRIFFSSRNQIWLLFPSSKANNRHHSWVENHPLVNYKTELVHLFSHKWLPPDLLLPKSILFEDKAPLVRFWEVVPICQLSPKTGHCHLH